jgi:hypothetical protein
MATPAPAPVATPLLPNTAIYTAVDAQREALGKSIALIGTTVGAVGTIMALSVNPTFKGSRGSKTKILGILALGGLAAWGVSYYLNQTKQVLVPPRQV